MTYSVLMLKSTRGAFLQKSGLDLREARKLANEMLDGGKPFEKARMLSSGIAFLVTPDAYATEVADRGIVMIDREKVLWQAGSY